MTTKHNSMKGNPFQVETEIYKHKLIKKLKFWTTILIFLVIYSPNFLFQSLYSLNDYIYIALSYKVLR